MRPRVYRLVRWLTLAALLLGCNRPVRRDPGSGTPPAIPSSTTTEEQLVSGGLTRFYRLHVPASYDANTPVPLVLNLHGLGQSPSQQEVLSSLSAKAEAANFIVVYPQGNGDDYVWYDWPRSADIQFIRDLIDLLADQYNLDPDRIYVTGISNGGGMANRLACAAADLIAAIGAVAGAYNLWEDCAPSRPVPVIAFHGTGDNIVPYGGLGQGNLAPPIRTWAAAWAERNACDPESTATYAIGTVTGESWVNCDSGADVVLYTIADGGHTWPGAVLLPEATPPPIVATDVIWDFFQAHPRP
jgi:polyhydroxybutyrate depolymerase